MRSVKCLARTTIQRFHLLPAVARVRWWLRLVGDPAFRAAERQRAARARRFARECGPIVRTGPACARDQGPVLVSTIGFDAIEVELGLVTALERHGARPVVLAPRDRWLGRYLRAAGLRRVCAWDEFLPAADVKAARRIVSARGSIEELLAFEHEGLRVGRYAAATTLRQLRMGSLDLKRPEVRDEVVKWVALGCAYAEGARRLVKTARPRYALFVDRGYTGSGELFDACLEHGATPITWNAAHKSNALIVKRYGAHNRGEHPSSLSDRSWWLLRERPWTAQDRERLHSELRGVYSSGDWYSEVGTQFNRRLVPPAELRARLGIRQGRKIALICPHILWDGTFFWGRDLFASYEDWFVETVRAACANPAVQWIIKLHPANIIKNARDGVVGEPAEQAVIQREMGTLTGHVTLVPPDSELSTLSFFEAVDSCVTVRGTVGIEAAAFGVPVLTAGTGRYDRKGFTIDSDSREQYLARLARIQEMPPLSAAQHELAERFAHGVFVLRPLPLRTVTLEYRQDHRASLHTQINARTSDEWRSAPDLEAFARWVVESDDDDFLVEPMAGRAG